MAKWKYSYDSGHAKATLLLDGREFVGEAHLHPEDAENESQRKGYTLAETRAYIKVLQHHIQNELKPALKALKHLNCCIQQSKNYNPKSYEARMLTRNLRLLDEELQECKSELNILKDQYHAYLGELNNRRP